MSTRDSSSTSEPLPLAVLQRQVAALPASPRDAGRVTLIVARSPGEGRSTPESVTLSRAEGVSGDDWCRREPCEADAQLAVMEHSVALLIANGQPLSVFGDNLIVELDLSAENLPLGTRLRVGEALVEVTAKPHDGCRKFKERFGQDALRFVAAKPTRHRNFRGIYWKVVEEGAVSVGSPVEVVDRAGEA